MKLNTRIKEICLDIAFEINYFFNTTILFWYRTAMNATVRRIKLGFNPEDLYSFDITMAHYILPRLKYFKTIINGHPSQLTHRQWVREINKMIAAFELISAADYHFCSQAASLKRDKIINDGLDSFRKYYLHLWW